MESEGSFWNRRDFFEGGETSAATLGMTGVKPPTAQTAMPADTPYKLSHSRRSLAFAAQTDYEGVVLTPDGRMILGIESGR